VETVDSQSFCIIRSLSVSVSIVCDLMGNNISIKNKSGSMVYLIRVSLLNLILGGYLCRAFCTVAFEVTFRKIRKNIKLSI